MAVSATIVGEWFAGSAVTAAGIATVAGAVAEAGAVMYVAGVATNDKNLTSVGGDMALAGGVVGLGAASVGAFTSTAATDVAATNVADVAPSATTVGADATVAAPGADASLSASNAFGPDASTMDPSLTQSIGSAPSVNALTANPASTLSSDPTMIAQNSGGVFNPAPVNLAASSPQISTANSALGKIPKGGNVVEWFNSLDAPTKAIVTSGLIQGVGGALGGLSSAYSAQQQLQFQQLKNSQDFQKYATAIGNLNNAPAQAYAGTPMNAGSGGIIGSNLLTGAA